MQRINSVKGTKDLLGNELINHEWLKNSFEEICSFFNYEKIVTPIIEHSEVFNRSLGEASDIVSKEMYNFIDQGGDHLVLRPEGTAAIARSFISNSFNQKLINKYFYSGPMFRRERPQSGRLRQFNQLGIECFGNANFSSDLEVIILAEKFLEKIGLRHNLNLEVNSLGNTESRQKYTKSLKEYFIKTSSKLSEESKKRVEKNPLRILDSKDLNDKEIIKECPKIETFYDKESQEFFENLINGLEKIGIKFNINSKLVRGLDYYNHTTFEYKTMEDKRQNTVLAGGRFDGLVHMLGGDRVGGVGWAAGVERILLNLNLNTKSQLKVISIFSNIDSLNLEILKIINNLDVQEQYKINFINSGNFKKKMTKASKVKSEACIIVGEEEWKTKKIIWKDFNSGEQETLSIENLKDFINKKIIKK